MKPCQHCGESLQNQVTICPTCNHELAEGPCPNVELAEQVREQERVRRLAFKKRSARDVAILFGVFGGLIGLIGGVVPGLVGVAVGASLGALVGYYVPVVELLGWL